MHRSSYRDFQCGTRNLQQKFDLLTHPERLMEPEKHTTGGKILGNGPNLLTVAQQSRAQVHWVPNRSPKRMAFAGTQNRTSCEFHGI